MLKRHWRLLLVGGVVAILIFGWWWNQPNDLRNVNIGDDAGRLAGPHGEEEYTPHSASVVCERDCWIHFGFGGESELSTVVPGDVEAAHPADKAKQQTDSLDQFDLLAQERMAHWAILVAILTGAGVVLLYETLRETGNATNAAIATTEATKRIGEAQTRAYIFPDSIIIRKVNQTGSTRMFRLVPEIKYKNSGQSPALDVTIFARINLGEAPSELVEPPEVGSRTVLMAGQEHFADGVLQTIFMPGQILAAADANKTIWVTGFINYADVFGVKWKSTFAFKALDFKDLHFVEHDEIAMMPLASGNSLERIDPQEA